MVNGVPLLYLERRKPTCQILIAGPSVMLPTGGVEFFGPFEDEENATLWAAEHLPERVLFRVVPVFATVTA